MKKLAQIVVLLSIVLMLAVPALAWNPEEYPAHWLENFDWAEAGWTIAWRNGWATPNGIGASPTIETSPSPTTSGTHSIRQAAGVSSAAKRSLKSLNIWNKAYYQGVVRFSVYDPYPTDSTGKLITSQVDTRVGVYSNQSTAAGDSGSMTYVQAAGITDTRGAYWTAYATSGFVLMDGNTTNNSTLYTLTSKDCTPAPRKAGWNTVTIIWSADPVAKTLHTDYYINRNSLDPHVNAVLDCNYGTGTGTRYAAIQDVAGIFVGSGSKFAQNAYVDDVYFSEDRYSNFPEPSSILALGAGLLGLVGMVRKKR